MVANCGICGQFSEQMAEKTVWFRGLDKRGETKKIETGVTDVFIGECCGLGLVESDDIHRDERSYQRHLNGVADGDLRYVMMVEESVPPAEVEVVADVGVDEGGFLVPSVRNESTKTVETSGVAYRPILGRRLPETVRQYVIGKIE